MTGPVNAVVGDDAMAAAFDIPVTQVPQDNLQEEKNLAAFSKTREFQRLKSHLEERIEFYQKYLPDGREMRGVKKEELAHDWEVANSIIREFKLVISVYEQAAQGIKDAEQNNPQ